MVINMLLFLTVVSVCLMTLKAIIFINKKIENFIVYFGIIISLLAIFKEPIYSFYKDFLYIPPSYETLTINSNYRLNLFFLNEPENEYMITAETSIEVDKVEIKIFKKDELYNEGFMVSNNNKNWTYYADMPAIIGLKFLFLEFPGIGAYTINITAHMSNEEAKDFLKINHPFDLKLFVQISTTLLIIIIPLLTIYYLFYDFLSIFRKKRE